MTLLAKYLTSISALLLLCTAANCAEQLYQDKPPRTPELAKVGPLPVGVKTLEITNPEQLNMQDFSSLVDRKLLVEVWYPAKKGTGNTTTYDNVTRSGKPFSIAATARRDAEVAQIESFPLVVLSHGYTGYRTIMFYLGEHLASHGYVVVGIDHTDSTNAEIDIQNAPFAGFPSTLRNRSRDQQFVLDYFAQGSHFLSDVIDTQRVGLIGYSMGAWGAINTVGGCYQFTPAHLMRLGFPEDAATNLTAVFNFCNAGREQRDPRWAAMMAFAPWGQELQLHAPEALAGITVPTMYVAGDNDDIVGYEQGVKKLFQQTEGKDTHMLVYREARHNFAPHPAPEAAFQEDIDLGHYAEPAWDAQVLNRNNQHFALLMMNCYVRQQNEACEFLPKRENANQVKQADGKLTQAWPGFPDRWATGMSFYKKSKE